MPLAVAGVDRERLLPPPVVEVVVEWWLLELQVPHRVEEPQSAEGQQAAQALPVAFLMVASVAAGVVVRAALQVVSADLPGTWPLVVEGLEVVLLSALQLQAALAAAGVELRSVDGLAARVDELLALTGEVSAAAESALVGELSVAELERVRFTLGRLEAALRARVAESV